MPIEEIWRDVKGYEGYYQVSNTGFVKSLERKCEYCDGRIYYIKERILTRRENDDGYFVCKLTKNKIGKYHFVHRLVANAFIPNPKNLPEINHLDCNRKNNLFNNLEWCTHKDNIRYAIKMGNHYCCRDLTGTNNPNYQNHKLRIVYANNPKLAIEKLSRPRSINGRAKQIQLLDNRHEMIELFGCIDDCASYLKSKYKLKQTITTIHNNINKSIKENKAYLGYYFKTIN